MDLCSATNSLMRVDDMSISVGALSTTVLPDETLKASGSLVFLTFKLFLKELEKKQMLKSENMKLLVYFYL